ncbi:hypothetical protein CPB83DRAFT_909951 [Crepidotus variabilis]|uniref:Uncharacterized protein n=1 Tax=Crepidotus variabilis TaxID=179855 RepID=A0A9P6E8G6_9AGAR|nr:hypothetical protein CPB83DRAFT_909951 [Crepidotus variabilis]
MMDNDTTTNFTYAILNPMTPFSFVPVEIAEQLEIVHYVIVGCLAVILWDIVVSGSDDYRLYRKKKFTLVTGVFLAARSTAIISLLYTSLVHTAGLDNCRTHVFIDIAMLVLNRALNTFLYFSRLYAVYQRNPQFTSVFATFWALVVGAACVSFASVRGVQIGPTRFCALNIENDRLLIIPPIIEAVYSLSISVAISYKMDTVFCGAETGEQRRRFTFNEAGWNYFSCRFLQDSQVYFVLTACLKSLELLIIPILHIIPALKPYRSTLLYPDMVVMNILSSHIYRHTRVGQDGIMTPSTQTISTSMPGFSPMGPATTLSEANPGSRSNGIRVYTSSSTLDDELREGELIDSKTQLP